MLLVSLLFTGAVSQMAISSITIFFVFTS